MTIGSSVVSPIKDWEYVLIMKFKEELKQNLPTEKFTYLKNKIYLPLELPYLQ